MGVGVQGDAARCRGEGSRPAGSGGSLFFAEQLGETQAPAEIVPTAFFAAPVRVSRGFVALYDHVIVIGKKA